MSARSLRINIPASTTIRFVVSENASLVCKDDAMLDVHFNEARVGLDDSGSSFFLQVSHHVTKSEERALYRAHLPIHPAISLFKIQSNKQT
jgi:hypothetical protein